MTPIKPLREKLRKGDFEVSIQASRTHYCTPRDDYGPWTHVELGYPSKVPPPEILEFIEQDNSDETPLRSVYSNIPVNLVTDWLKSEGFTEDELSNFGFHHSVLY